MVRIPRIRRALKENVMRGVWMRSSVFLPFTRFEGVPQIPFETIVAHDYWAVETERELGG